MSLYIGFDCSTQGLTTVAIEAGQDKRRVVYERSLSFDSALPQYGTERGVLRSSTDPRVVFAPPLMWVDALDLAMEGLAADLGDAIGSIQAISGSGQQHGSVYLNEAGIPLLGRVESSSRIGTQVGGIFSRREAPIWMDSSTTTQCREIARQVGGDAALAALTGSRAFERFTGPQIRKFFETDTRAYESTARIHLVSSFMASVLAGANAPIDHGDGSGMNLMDIRQRRWAPAALDATAPRLEGKLPSLAASWARVGSLSAYWQRRYRFPAAAVIAWSGDNPCSLIGTGLVREGRIAISLGTSDTVFGLMTALQVDPSGAGSVFASPTGDYMGLTCFSNGSLARERVRDRYGLSWDAFSDALRATPPGNGGALMLPWFEPEITPTVARPGVRRLALPDDHAAANVRAVVEAQVLAMKRHSAWMGVRVETIHATGGGSANREILRILADVFDADVYQFSVSNSAALGAALRAYHADALTGEQPISWDEAIAGFAEPIVSSRISPLPDNVRTYRELEGKHAAFEARELRSVTAS